MFEKNNHDLKLCVAMFLYPNKSNYPLLPPLSFQKKKFFQITLNKGHPHIEENWNNVCICFIQMVAHQYKNIKKNKQNNMVISRKKKEKQKFRE